MSQSPWTTTARYTTLPRVPKLRPSLEGQPRKGPFTREWAALLFAVISFIVAQLIVVTLHYRATRLTHETEEIKLARAVVLDLPQPGLRAVRVRQRGR